MNLSPTIRERIRGKQDAKSAMELLAEFFPKFDGEPAAYVNGFWEAVVEEGLSHLPSKPSVEAVSRPKMSDDEATRFEKRKLGFGKHADETYGNCPTEYLLFLAARGEELSAYLRSRIGQQRQD